MSGGNVVSYNPKKHRPVVTQKTIEFNSVENPLMIQVTDDKLLRSTFNKLPLIPYAGNAARSSQGLLYFLNSCRSLSGTQGACHNSIKTYAFGNKLKIVNTETEFDLGEIEEVSLETKKSFAEFVKQIDLGKLNNFTELSHYNYDGLKGNGNYWLELVFTETAGVKQSAIHAHPTEHCIYKNTKAGEPRIVVVSIQWDEQYLRENPPAQIPLFPNYHITKKGTVSRTMIHVKNGSFEWYGRPDWMAAWMHCYKEYQATDYSIKTAANGFTGEVFIETEDNDVEYDNAFDDTEAQEAGFDSIAHRWDENFTKKVKNPQSFIITSRPYGAKAAFIYQFKPNTDEKYYDIHDKVSRRKILENNQWSERLLGSAVAEGFSDSYIPELKTKEISVLTFYRDEVSKGINIAINEIAKYMGRKDMEGKGIYYKSSFELLSEDDGLQQQEVNEE